jgi:SAM-dependent methyltransferase
VSQAAGGYVEYDATTETFVLPPEQAVAFTDESSPACIIGGYLLANSLVRDEPHIREVFRTGKGFTWGQHHADLFEGTEKFFRPGYIGNLVGSWIPALDGVTTKLERGATVADVGCGHGASTIIMAKAFPSSRFFGFDDHAPSIAAARDAAAGEGVADRVTFEVASAQAYPGRGYDLVAFFDCLHDMGDPIGALKRTAATLDADGSVLIVEPMAGATVEENLNPVGRVFASASVLVCTPHALATGNTHLGTIATDEDLRAVATAAGLGRFRRATETPFNRVFEAKL